MPKKRAKLEQEYYTQEAIQYEDLIVHIPIVVYDKDNSKIVFIKNEFDKLYLPCKFEWEEFCLLKITNLYEIQAKINDDTKIFYIAEKQKVDPVIKPENIVLQELTDENMDTTTIEQFWAKSTWAILSYVRRNRKIKHGNFSQGSLSNQNVIAKDIIDKLLTETSVSL